MFNLATVTCQLHVGSRLRHARAAREIIVCQRERLHCLTQQLSVQLTRHAVHVFSQVTQ